MPITRVPVVHKFGIISQTQRVELEKRIAKKALIETRRKVEACQPPDPRPLPFEVTEDFVYKFNDSSKEEKEKLEDTAIKMLKRLKRLAGLRQAGEAYHVDLPRAWVDLALLAQCRSFKLEEACLEALIASLDQALVCEEQILSLFYLAKSGVHWLKKDTGNQSVLRSNEILLLKMTRLVFIRLYCHHLLGQLKEYEDQRTSLGQYLEGFSEKARSFDQFPGAYLTVRLISDAGRAICSSMEEFIQNESTTIIKRANDVRPEDATIFERQNKDKENLLQQTVDTKTQDQVARVEHRSQIEPELTESEVENKTNYDKDVTSGEKESVPANAYPNTETGNSIFLQCSLDVWYAVIHDPASLNDALCDLLGSATHITEKQWVELVLAFHVLADASCKSARVLEAFQYFMSLDFSPLVIPVDRVPHLCKTCYSSISTSPDKKALNSTTFRENLSTIDSLPGVERSTTASLVETLKEFVGLDLTQAQEEELEVRKATRDSMTYSSQPRRSKQEVTTIPADSYSVASQPQRRHLRHRWPWELLYTFCDCLATVCLHGACSDVQKFSLLGMNEKTFKRYKSEMKFQAGLIEFLGYEDGEDGWKVRYGAVKSLVRVCRHYSNDVSKEGVTNTAWSALVQHESSESEPRVLEAMKIAKVEAELEKKLSKEHIPVSLWISRIASALTDVQHYHPMSLTSARVPDVATRVEQPKKGETQTHSDVSATSRPERCKKPSLRQEINISNACREAPTSYNTRMNLELRAVIEDQWKKQLLEEMEREVKTNIEELEKKREQELTENIDKNSEKRAAVK